MEFDEPKWWKKEEQLIGHYFSLEALSLAAEEMAISSMSYQYMLSNKVD